MATDMIVDVRDLIFEARYAEARSGHTGAVMRRAREGDREELRAFIEREFGERWARAVDVALSNDPVAAFIATEADEIVGFAFYDIAFRGYLGPMGVREDRRGRDIGGRLLISVLKDMARAGYAFAIIGDVGPVEFYEKVAGAAVIPPTNGRDSG